MYGNTVLYLFRWFCEQISGPFNIHSLVQVTVSNYRGRQRVNQRFLCGNIVLYQYCALSVLMPLRRESLVLIAAGAMFLAVTTVSLYTHFLDVHAFNTTTVCVLAIGTLVLTAIALFLFLHAYYAMTESREKGGEGTTNYGGKGYHQP